MPRTATILGKTHKGKWELISTPDVSILDQNKVYRSMLGSRSHDKYSLIRYQESDGPERVIHLRTPDAQAAIDLEREESNKEVEAQAKKDLENAKSAQKEADDFRAARHAAEIDELNKTHDAIREGREQPKVAIVAPQKPQGEVQSEGLRLDGPTPLQWAAAGMAADKYPPAGYAAKEDKEFEAPKEKEVSTPVTATTEPQTK